MKDKLRESVSALVDNEAEELEIRRILSQSHDQEVLTSWQHFHQIRASLKPEESRWAGIDLSEGINAALDGELSDGESGPVNTDRNSGANDTSATAKAPVNDSADAPANDTGTNKHWWRGLAIAASVAFAVVFAVQFDFAGRQQGPVVAKSSGDTTLSVPSVVADSTDSADSTDTADSSEFSQQHESRLNEYIMRHTGHAALNTGKSIVPFARLTSFEREQEAVVEKVGKE